MLILHLPVQNVRVGRNYLPSIHIYNAIFRSLISECFSLSTYEADLKTQNSQVITNNMVCHSLLMLNTVPGGRLFRAVDFTCIHES